MITLEQFQTSGRRGERFRLSLEIASDKPIPQLEDFRVAELFIKLFSHFSNPELEKIIEQATAARVALRLKPSPPPDVLQVSIEETISSALSVISAIEP